VTNIVRLVFPLSEYIKIDVSWDTGGTYSAPLSPVLVSRGRFTEGRGWKEGVVDGREGLVNERRGRGEEGEK